MSYKELHNTAQDGNSEKLLNLMMQKSKLNLLHKPFKSGQRQMEEVYQMLVFQGKKFK